jgi:hypothetical protein
MKKTLLMAAAALAASVITSNAGVYSQNIVGYANLPAPSGNSLLACQFVMGVSNGVNEVFGENLPPGSEILTYNGSGYNIALFDNSNGAGTPEWYYGDDQTPLPSLPTLSPGQGFFLVANGKCTNTFAGAIAINVGTSNNMTLSAGNHLVGCPVPYAGLVTNGNPVTAAGGPNLNNLPPGTELLFYVNGGYNIALFDNSNGAGTPNWYYGDDQTPYVDPSTGGNVPTISVGQGFFIVPNGSYTWTVGL